MPRITVRIERIVEEYVELDVQDDDDARQKIAGLYNDHFSEVDRYYSMTVEDDKGEDITGRIQPNNTLIQP